MIRQHVVRIYHQNVFHWPTHSPVKYTTDAISSSHHKTCLPSSLWTENVSVRPSVRPGLYTRWVSTLALFCAAMWLQDAIFRHCIVLIMHFCVESHFFASTFRYAVICLHSNALLVHVSHAWCIPSEHRVRHQRTLYTGLERAAHNTQHSKTVESEPHYTRSVHCKCNQ